MYLLLFSVLTLTLRHSVCYTYRTCSKTILGQLGQLYTAGGAFTQNINAAGGPGTAEFASKAIEVYCRTAK